MALELVRIGNRYFNPEKIDSVINDAEYRRVTMHILGSVMIFEDTEYPMILEWIDEHVLETIPESR